MRYTFCILAIIRVAFASITNAQIASLMDANPYQSPIQPTDRVQLDVSGARGEFFTPRTVVVPLLYAGAVVSLLEATAMASQAWLFMRMNGAGNWTREEAELNDVIVGGATLLYLGLYLVTMVAWWRWQLRAAHNIRAFGRRQFDFSPGSSLGWYFVPFMNLYKPYQAMKEIDQASDPAVDVDGARYGVAGGTALVGGWWTLWIVRIILSRATFRLPDETISDLQTASLVAAGEAALHLVLCLVAARMIRRINHNQMEKSQRLQAA
jgi:hypothetical protein